MKQKIFTLQKIYKEGVAALTEAGIAEAALDAWYLLEYVTNISGASYYGDPERELTEGQVRQYRDCIARRKSRIPLQHITGEQEFMGYSFYVNEHVLIPRQDTEVLVEEAIKVVRAGTPGMKVLDMCTGSGCILLSLLKLCPGTVGTGCDISEDALKVAKRNSERLEVAAEFVQSNLFEHIEEKYQLIVSNPPYIRTAVIKELQEEVRFHDPRIALDGREDGLYFYRKIIEEGKRYLEDGGFLMFEIGHDQGSDVSYLMGESGYKDIKVKKDLAGLDRVVTGMYNKR